MTTPTLIAILGPTASGKSEAALKLAKELDAEIFSLDSLSIYQGIDILSAKPSKQDLATIKHYAINLLSPDSPNNAALFCSLLKDAILACQKPFLIITGGSSFYLKAILNGLSPMPTISQEIKQYISTQNLDSLYQRLKDIDPNFIARISPKDSYRIARAFEIYLASEQKPSEYFASHPPTAFPHKIHLYAIQIQREILRERIHLRTRKMLDSGAIDEMRTLLKSYPETCQPFRAIGPKECIAYLSHQISLDECQNLITTHTSQLAKRQDTFNRTQFSNLVFLPKDQLVEEIYLTFKSQRWRSTQLDEI